MIVYLYKKGFTLIELLVVVSIISLLSSIVFSSLKSAHGQAADSAIKSNMHAIFISAELEFSNLGNSYNNTANNGNNGFPACDGATTPGMIYQNAQIQQALAQIKTLNGGVSAVCVVHRSAYAIAVALKTSGKFWCIDSTGRASGNLLSGGPYLYLAGGPSGPLSAGNDDVCN